MDMRVDETGRDQAARIIRNRYTGGDGRQQIRRTAHRFDEAVAAKDNAISLGRKRLGRIGQKRIVPTGHNSATQGGHVAAVVVRFHEASRGLNRLWPRNAHSSAALRCSGEADFYCCTNC